MKTRIERLAEIYAKMITPDDEESFKETCTRLRAAIGCRIEKDVFFEAVKMIRKGDNYV